MQFITAAEIILRKFGKPLKVNDILDQAIKEGLIKSKGKTPENTMRARLSEHIREHKDQSIFIRVRSNIFALREWDHEEYKAPIFIKNSKYEEVVCLKQDALEKIGRFFGFNPNYSSYLNLLRDKNNIDVIKREKANNNYDAKQLVSYVILKNNSNEILSFTRGKFSSIKDRLLKGVLCIGFGGHVNVDDYYNFFGSEDAGLKNSVYRELNEELRDIKIEEPKLVGVINDDSSLLGYNHFAFVFTTTIKKTNEKKINTEQSINQLEFLSINELNNRFSELEFWSQLVLKNIILNNREEKKVLIKDKKQEIKFPIIIVGEIGSGKTEIAKIIARKLNSKFISTRKIVADLLEIEDFGIKNRKEFQYKSYQFVKSNGGCNKIAERLIETISFDSKIIIDGIRHLDTFDMVKNYVNDLTLIYIDLPIDNSYYFFKKRSKRDVTIHEFREVRMHEVEKEVVLFKNRADVYVYNGNDFNELVIELTRWIDEK